MPPVANYALDGVALTNAEYGWLLTADTQLDLPLEAQTQDVSLPGAHGVVAGLPAPYGAPVLEFTHDIVGNSQAQLRERHRALVSLLRGGSTLRRSENGVEPVEARAELVSVSTPSMFIPGRSMQFTSQFRLPSVFWRSIDYTVETYMFDSLLDDIEVQGARGSTAPIMDTQLRVRGPLSSLVFVDNASRTSVRWGGTIAQGSAVYIHCAEHVARVVHSLTYNWSLDAGTDASGGLYTTQTGMLRLTPTPWEGDPTDRRVIVDVNGSGRAGGENGTRLTVRTRGAFL